ncbi:MAG: BrnA antitoxin family protein [Chloroflexi bacterium]|nr:BrnA antitoxin family protein [Chloroflexota bacterium]
MSAKSTTKRPVKRIRPTQGRADLPRLRRVSESEIARTSPPELARLPDDFWDEAEIVVPAGKQPISFRVDRDVLAWFRESGPRYQTRMNAVLRAYVAQMRKRQPMARRRRRV